MRNNLLIETVAIGLFTIVMEFFVYFVLTGEFPGPRLGHFYKMLAGAFLLGASIHLVLEFAGVNERWCKAEF